MKNNMSKPFFKSNHRGLYLAHVLFFIFVNDISMTVSGCILYVDDVVLIDKDLESMNENLSKIANCCDTIFLTLFYDQTIWYSNELLKRLQNRALRIIYPEYLKP